MFNSAKETNNKSNHGQIDGINWKKWTQILTKKKDKLLLKKIKI